MTRPEHPESLWHRTGATIDVDAELPDRASVVIAGAGLAGITTALLLARGGVDVVVIEADRVGARTTGNTTAKLSALQGTAYSSIRRHNGDTAVRDYGRATMDARDWLAAELAGIDGAIEHRDALTYAATDSGAALLTAEAEALAVGEVDAVWGDAEHPDVPTGARAVLRLADQYQLHPVIALAHLTREARAAGARVVTGRRVRDVTVNDGSVVVAADGGQVVTDRLVVATGLPILDRGLFFAHMVPSRQYVGAFAIPGGVRPIAMSLSVDPVERSLRDARDRDGSPLLVVGGNSFTTGRDDDTRTRLDALERWVASSYGESELVTWWAAQDYAAEHRLPFAGPMPRGHDRVYAATGFAKWGMTGAVLAAHAIAGDLLGGAPEWAPTFRGRRGSLRTLGGVAAANASVAKELVEGWARPQPRSADAPDVHRDGVIPTAEPNSTGCALRTVCTHLGGVLRWNTAERTWDCPLHGSRFDGQGHVIEGPATDDLASSPDKGEK